MSEVPKAVQQFLDEAGVVLSEEKAVRPQDRASTVTKYGISADMWRTWAAAAGYPGARWDDPKVAQKVAEWAVSQLYEEFGSWSLVAIGWRFGPGAARQVQRQYGGMPNAEVIERIMGKTSANFVDRILTKLYGQEFDRQIAAMDQGGPIVRPMGEPAEVELRFKTEEGEPLAPESSGLDAGSVLRDTLASMANIRAGGQRLTIEQAMEREQAEGGMARNVTPEDNQGGL